MTRNLSASQITARQNNSEIIAESLFGENGCLTGRKRHVYSEMQINRKLSKDIQWDNNFDYGGISEKFSEVLSSSLINEAVKIAKLSEIEEMCIRLHIAGLNTRQTAQLLRITRSKAHNLLKLTIKKLRNAVKTDPYISWYQVYLQEINRYKKSGSFKIIR